MERWFFSPRRHVPRRLLEAMRRDCSGLVLSNVQPASAVPFLAAARRLRLPVVAHVASWDHTVGKGVISPYCDLYVVQNRVMEDDLRRYHGIAPERVASPAGRRPTSSTAGGRAPSTTRSLRALRARPRAPARARRGNTPSNAPYEGRFVERLVAWWEESPRERLQLLFRPAPARPRLAGALRRGARARGRRRPGGELHRPRGRSRRCSSTRTSSSATRARSCSTRSSATGRPSASSTTRGRRPGESWAAKNVVGKHYEELAASGAFYRAERFEEVVAGIERALEQPDELAAERRRAVEQVVGEVDGRAAERVVDAVAEVLGGTRGEGRHDAARAGRGGRRRRAGRLPPARRRRLRHRDGQRARPTARREILERYERAGRLRLLREPGDDMRQDEWVTRMARLAATEHGADWVINSDADEFWWPRGGSLKDVLATVPARFGVVRGCWRHFLPRPDDGSFFAERMTVRLATPAHPGDKETIFHAHQKVAHRAHRRRRDRGGEPQRRGAGARAAARLASARGPALLVPLGRPARAQGSRRLAPQPRPVRADAAPAAARRGAARRAGSRRSTTSLAVDDEALARGLADGTLAVDTRLRDALRALRDDGRELRPARATGRRSRSRGRAPPRTRRTQPRRPSLVEIDGIVRAEQRVRALEQTARRARARRARVSS